MLEKLEIVFQTLWECKDLNFHFFEFLRQKHLIARATVTTTFPSTTSVKLRKSLEISQYICRLHILWSSLLNPCSGKTTTCAVFPDGDNIDAASGRTHLLVRQVKQKLPVKAPGPPECRVDRVESVCSTNDHYLPATVQAVHQGQQGGHNRTASR